MACLIIALTFAVLDICKEHGIRYQYVSAIAIGNDTEQPFFRRLRSFWTLSGNPALLKSPPILQLSEKHGLTPQQVLFKFCQRRVSRCLLRILHADETCPSFSLLISIGITPLSGTTNADHMAEDVAVESIPDFSPSEVRGLEAALRKAATQME